MLQSLSHRGSGESGVARSVDWIVGQCALNPGAAWPDAGSTPLWSYDKRYCLAFDGDLFNLSDLRRRLGRKETSFESDGAAGVFLELIAAEGFSALAECNGFFAFALFDALDDTLTLGRDRLGVKPLYHMSLLGGGLAFASEIKALAKLPGFVSGVDQKSLEEYLVFQYSLGEETLFSGVGQIAPGGLVRRLPDGETRREKWHDGRIELDFHHTEEYFVDHLTALIRDAVDLQLRCEKPVGVYVSGGIDSSLVGCLASELNGLPLPFFHGRFSEHPGYDESRHARAVAEARGCELHLSEPTPEEFVDWMPRIIESLDVPAAGPGVFPQFIVAKQASGFVGAVMGGQGGDEVFGGYARYLVAYLEQALKGAIFESGDRTRHVLTLENIIPNLSTLKQYVPMLKIFFADGLFDDLAARYFRLVDRSPSLMPMLHPGLRERLRMDDVYQRYLEIFESSSGGSSINRMLDYDQKTSLPALLHVEDRVGSHFSMLSRLPLLDWRIVELGASVPPRIKLKEGQLKYLLRRAARDFVPDAVLKRKDKMGFPVPLAEWMAGGPVRDFVADTLLSSASRQRGVYSEDALHDIVGKPPMWGRQLWGALCLELWHRRFIDNKA